jgi:hypothetical protein
VVGVELLTPAASARKLFSVVVLPAEDSPGRQAISPACGVLSIKNTNLDYRGVVISAPHECNIVHELRLNESA